MRTLLPLSLALLALAGCKRQEPVPAPEPSMATQTKPGIVVSGARLVLPAVPGHPAALYMTVANQAALPARLERVEVAGAGKTEMHETRDGGMVALNRVPMDPGGMVIFAPGARHVMVFDVKPSIKPGAIVDVTLHFHDGRTFVSQARAESAGGDDGTSMGGMDQPMSAMPGHGEGAH